MLELTKMIPEATKLMEMIRKRQIELANKAAEAEKNKGQAGQPAADGQAQAGAVTSREPAPARDGPPRLSLRRSRRDHWSLGSWEVRF